MAPRRFPRKDGSAASPTPATTATSTRCSSAWLPPTTCQCPTTPGAAPSRCCGSSGMSSRSPAEVAPMIKAGHFEKGPPLEGVRGWIRLFPRTELAKSRRRILKHTHDKNDACGRELLQREHTWPRPRCVPPGLPSEFAANAHHCVHDQLANRGGRPRLRSPIHRNPTHGNGMEKGFVHDR